MARNLTGPRVAREVNYRAPRPNRCRNHGLTRRCYGAGMVKGVLFAIVLLAAVDLALNSGQITYAVIARLGHFAAATSAEFKASILNV